MDTENLGSPWRQVRIPSTKVAVRPRDPADDARIVEIYNSIEWDFPPLRVAEYRLHGDASAESGYFEQFVAEGNGEVSGYCVLSASAWAQQRKDYLGSIRVHSGSRRHGFGSRLYDQLLHCAHVRGARRLHGWIREDLPAARQFVEQRGFRPTGRSHGFLRLHTSTPLMGTEEIERDLHRLGITVTTLAELGGGADETLHHLHATVRGDVSLREMTRPDRSAAATWVTLDGDRATALSWLQRRGRQAAFHEQIGIVSGEGGRVVARALARRAVEWAHTQGIEWLYMGGAGTLPADVCLYREIGYRPLAVKVEVMKDMVT